MNIYKNSGRWAIPPPACLPFFEGSEIMKKKKKARWMRLRNENKILIEVLRDIKIALIKACEYLNEHGVIISSTNVEDDGVVSWYKYFLNEAKKENLK
jgi:hypothetical protein